MSCFVWDVLLGEKKEEDAMLVGPKVDRVRRMFSPLRAKTLKNALAHVIGRDFPRKGVVG
jgi:hypothetical protein